MQTDDNLQGGLNYTFTFSGPNESISQVLADLSANAPSFIGSPTASWTGTAYLNITFNYTGDGSDVASDVANEIISSLSSPGFMFVQVATGTAGVTAINPSSGGAGPTYSFSFWNLLPSSFGGQSVTPAQKAANTAAEQAQINSVAQNAQSAYGSGSATAVTAVQTAQVQSAQASADNSSIATTYQQLLDANSSQWLILFAVMLGVAAWFFLSQRQARTA
jgi:hypothetical protein